LCNTRWRLLERTTDGWKPLAEADAYKQREPTILTTDAKEGLYLYANDSLMPPGAEYGACEPHLLRFDLGTPPIVSRKMTPTWEGTPTFTDHSYRGYAADAQHRQIAMFNIDAQTSEQNYCFLSMDGQPFGNGKLTFPIRACYPQVAIENGRAHIVAVGDIVEPNKEWQQYKFEKTGSKWDYVFRRLFYARCNDLKSAAFAAPIEIANVDATAGHIANQDLWIAPNGDAYILYIEREVSSAIMRDKFFPGKSTLGNLVMAIAREGKPIERHVLLKGNAETQPGNARFHVMANGDVYALLYVSGAHTRNVLMPISPKLDPEELIDIPFKAPFGSFLNASVRAGNAQSNTIDVIGHNGVADAVSYGQIVFE